MTTTTIRVSEPRELLAYIPYRLGFRPRRSAVVVSLRGARGRLGLVARVDLDDLADPESGPALASGLANHLWRDGAERAVLVVYDDARDEPFENEARKTAVGHVLDSFARFVVSTQVWLVDGERYFGVDCADRACCPPEGRPLGDLDSTAVSAEMVFAGATIAEHRSEMTAIVPAAKSARYNVARVARRWAQRRQDSATAPEIAAWRVESLRAWHDVVDLVRRGLDVPARLLGRLDAGLRDPFVRDGVIMSVTEGPDAAESAMGGEPDWASRRMGAAFGSIFDADTGTVPDPGDRETWCAALRLVVAHSPRGEHAPACSLLVLLSWWAGDGASANEWLTKALAAEPGYQLAQLLGATLEAAMPPGWVRRAAAKDATLR